MTEAILLGIIIGLLLIILSSRRDSSGHYPFTPQVQVPLRPSISYSSEVKHWKNISRQHLPKLVVGKNKFINLLKDEKFISNSTKVGKKFGLVGLYLGQKVYYKERKLSNKGRSF